MTMSVKSLSVLFSLSLLSASCWANLALTQQQHGLSQSQLARQFMKRSHVSNQPLGMLATPIFSHFSIMPAIKPEHYFYPNKNLSLLLKDWHAYIKQLLYPQNGQQQQRLLTNLVGIYTALDAAMEAQSRRENKVTEELSNNYLGKLVLPPHILGNPFMAHHVLGLLNRNIHLTNYDNFNPKQKRFGKYSGQSAYSLFSKHRDENCHSFGLGGKKRYCLPFANPTYSSKQEAAAKKLYEPPCRQCLG